MALLLIKRCEAQPLLGLGIICPRSGLITAKVISDKATEKSIVQIVVLLNWFNF